MTPKLVAIVVGLFLLLAVSMAVMVTRGGAGSDHVKQYRGSYTWGHEVNEFCPQQEPTCYWISPASRKQVRDKLQSWAQTSQQSPYDSICIVVGGKPDSVTPSPELAEGRPLLLITDVLGRC